MTSHPFILLVEANPIVRALICGELKEHGCVVFDAADGDEALQFASLYPGAIDLAVADRSSVAMSGHEFVDALRALPTGAETNVIQLDAEAPDVFPGSATGLRQTLLMKPFDRTTLLHAVRRALPPTRTFDRGGRAVFWGSHREIDSDLDVAV